MSCYHKPDRVVISPNPLTKLLLSRGGKRQNRTEDSGRDGMMGEDDVKQETKRENLRHSTEAEPSVTKIYIINSLH